MKRLLACLSMLALLLLPALAAPASANTWGDYSTYSGANVDGLTSWAGTAAYIVPSGNWTQGSSQTNFQYQSLFIGKYSSANFIQIGVIKVGSNAAMDDCGANGNVRSIFAEWYVGGVFHCWWGQAVSNGEAHQFSVEGCTSNLNVWCVYVDGVQLGSSKNIGFNVSDKTYTGAEQGVNDATATNPADRYIWGVTNLQHGNPQTWHHIDQLDTCTQNTSGNYHLDVIPNGSGIWDVHIGTPHTLQTC